MASTVFFKCLVKSCACSRSWICNCDWLDLSWFDRWQKKKNRKLYPPGSPFWVGPYLGIILGNLRVQPGMLVELSGRGPLPGRNMQHNGNQHSSLARQTLPLLILKPAKCIKSPANYQKPLLVRSPAVPSPFSWAALEDCPDRGSQTDSTRTALCRKSLLATKYRRPHRNLYKT